MNKGKWQHRGTESRLNEAVGPCPSATLDMDHEFRAVTWESMSTEVFEDVKASRGTALRPTLHCTRMEYNHHGIVARCYAARCALSLPGFHPRTLFCNASVRVLTHNPVAPGCESNVR